MTTPKQCLILSLKACSDTPCIYHCLYEKTPVASATHLVYLETVHVRLHQIIFGTLQKVLKERTIESLDCSGQRWACEKLCLHMALQITVRRKRKCRRIPEQRRTEIWKSTAVIETIMKYSRYVHYSSQLSVTFVSSIPIFIITISRGIPWHSSYRKLGLTYSTYIWSIYCSIL